MTNPFDEIIRRDPRYRPEAYALVYEGLNHAQQLFKREHHVTGQELSDGIRLLCIERYGRMAKAVLNSWGLRSTDDFGCVVYNLIEAGMMGKTESDRIEDFHAVYDFDAAFVRNYQVGADSDSAA